MAQVKRTEMRWIEDAFGMGSGYVLAFSDRTFSEWFEDELGIDIDDSRYRGRGTSKANRLRGFVDVEPAPVVARALRALWDHRENTRWAAHHEQPEETAQRRELLFRVVDRLEGMGSTPAVDAIVSFSRDETLAELVEAIKRDAQAGKPAAALDRLHTFSMKKFAHLLAARGVPMDKSEPLHSRVGKYVKALEAERELRPITKQIFKNSVGVFQAYNDIRNHASFAHDNQIVEPDEARLIFENIVSMLRFVRSIEADRFEKAA